MAEIALASSVRGGKLPRHTEQLNRLYHRWRKEYAKTRTVPAQEDASGAAPAEASGLVPRPLIGAGEAGSQRLGLTDAGDHTVVLNRRASTSVGARSPVHHKRRVRGTSGGMRPPSLDGRVS